MIDLQAPLALADENLSAHFGADPVSGARIPDADLEGALHALGSVRGETQRIVALAAALSGDATQTPAARVLRLRENALAAGERSAKVLDGARNGLAVAIGRLDAETGAPPQLLGAGPVEVEVRAALRGMSKGARAAAIADAFTTNDNQVVGAILRGPALMSGLEAAEQDHWRTRYRYERCGQKAKHADRLRKALSALDRAGASLVEFTSKAANGDKAEATAKAAGRTSAALNEITS